MNPPRLLGNKGELGEFVLPLRNPNAKSSDPADDFTAEATAWTMAAHEARPGHELQFAAMVERGVSIARAAFAFNSTNAEGWGLYAESLMLPYFPSDGPRFDQRQFHDLVIAQGLLPPGLLERAVLEELTRRYLGTAKSPASRDSDDSRPATDARGR